jgi:serine protease
MKFNRCIRILAVAVLSLPCMAFSQGGGANPFGSGPKATTPAEENNSRPSSIIIKYKAGQVAAQNLSAAKVGQDTATLALDRVNSAAARHSATASYRSAIGAGAHSLKLNKKLTKIQMEELIKEIALDPAVEYVEEDRVLQRQLIPNDPNYQSSQWHYFEQTGGINLPAAWDLSIGTAVRVAVIDTGITSHPDLNSNIVGGYDFIADAVYARDGNGRDGNPADEGDGVAAWDPSSWHGTHVAGTVAAVTNNGTGVAGVAFGAKVIPIRVLGIGGGQESDIAAGIRWAAGDTVSGVPTNLYPSKILNLSLGGTGACSTTFQQAIDKARGLGALIIVAAGNNNIDASLFTPANCKGVLAVTATTQTGSKATFSNFGAIVGIAAPGTNIYSTMNSGVLFPSTPNYVSYNGTSMAAPHVAGVAALVWSKYPNMTADQVTAVLKSSARPFPGVCNQCGAGIVDAFAALNAAAFNIVPILDILLLSD